MKIKEIEFNNYRGFRGERRIVFQENVNVFLGANGAGKSSLLDLIATFLNQFTVKFSGNSNRELVYQLSMFDIHIEEDETRNKITIEKDNDLISWELIRNFKAGKNNFKALNNYIDHVQNKLTSDTQINIPVIKYFHSLRTTQEKQNGARSRKRYLAEQLKAYEGAFDKFYEFNDFVNWFVEAENKENRTKVKLKDLNHTNPELDALRTALRIFLGDFPSGNYGNLRVEERIFNTKTNEKSSLVIDKNGKTFNLKQLSDGEKTLILMVADIAHRLAVANPKLGKNCLSGEGIILLDEIDLHLHPAWQRDVIPCLLAAFPNIQFFISTHSPQVLSNVNEDNVFIIEDFEIVDKTPSTYGKDSNSILWDVFGVVERPVHAKDKLNKFYELIEEENQEEKAEELLSELAEQLGEDDPEILKARLHFEFQTGTHAE